MGSKYFSEWEFKQAFSFFKINPIESKIKFEEYLEKYPKDYLAYTCYSSVLIALKELDNAEKVLDYVDFLVRMDGNFIKESNRVNKFKRNSIFTRLRLLSYQEKYDELYQFYLNHFQIIKSMELNEIIFYCLKKNGKLDIDKREPNSYLFRQIVEYKENDFLDHIKKHLADYNRNLDKPNKNIFIPDFPINEIIEEIKKYIPSDKKLCFGFFEDIYIFKYNECGREDNRLVDYFKVVCFHNTKDIITICPLSECKDLPHTDLNYLIHNTENTKVKRISQIEKFNQKYKQK